MENDLLETFTDVVIGNKTISSIAPIFEKPQNGEYDHEAFIQNLLDAIWYIDTTIIDGANDKTIEGDRRRNLSSIVRYLHTNNVVDTKSMKTKLDITLLENAGIVEEKTFGRRCVRINTAMLYKQQKYNLAREESEGYSKLICELTMSYDALYKNENEKSRNMRVQSLLETIQTLIGFFNLDPNRVLDLILDVFIANVKNHYEFFIQLLKNSPWLPDPVDMDKYSPNYDILDEWSNDKGNPTCAHLLGTKFSRYKGSDMMPDAIQSLHIASAILVHNEIVKIADLYPHILKEPDDNDPYEHINGIACAFLEIGDFYHARYVLHHLPDIGESVAKCLREIINVAIHEVYVPIAPRLIKYFPTPTFFGSWYKPWSEGIPIFHSFMDLINENGRQLLQFVGPWLSKDLILLTKIMRITFHHLKESKNVPNREIIQNGWIEILITVILPSIAMPDITCGVIDELWNIIKLFPCETRYMIYAKWKLIYSTHQLLREQQKKVSYITKDILKKITEENCRVKGRDLAKISHANPIIVFEIILKQIQAYDNMMTSFVEACKYFTALEYDILTYQMLEIFACDRKRLKEDGVNISDWLKHLSDFCGNMCRKYDKMNLASILQFIVCKLKDRSSVDLYVLSQLITAMSGIKYEVIPSNLDVILMGTGENLRNIKLFNRNQKNVRRNSSRLGQILIEEGFAMKLAILIAQLAQSIPYEAFGMVEESAGLKSFVHQMDLCRNTYIQYVDFLAMTIGMDEYAAIVPDIEKLIDAYKLQMEYTFMLLRPVMNYKLKQHIDAMNVNNGPIEIWQPSLLPTIIQIESILPKCVWNGISPPFFITFWQLSLYDLEFPQEEYRKAKNDLLNSANDDKVRDKSKILDIARQIDEERRTHEQHVKSVKNRLKIEKEHWFSGQFTNRQDIITQFWQYCLFPRLITSADNAVFCAKFIETMHEIGTANFSTLTLYDRIFADQVQPLIFTCSESEARNYGVFLQTVLASLSKLHKNPQEYELKGKGSGIPGFQMKWSAHNRQPTSISETDLLQYEDFRRVYYKWHSKLLKAFEQGLQSMEYFSVRNSIIVLNDIVLYFPAIDTFGKKLQDNIDKIVKSGNTDILTLAISYSAVLKGRQQYWVSTRSFQKPKGSNATDSIPNDERSMKHDEKTEKNGPSSPSQRVNQVLEASRSSPLSNMRGDNSSPSHSATRANSPRRQIHPLPDRPFNKKDRDRDRERDRFKDRKDVLFEREKEIKKNDYHNRDKEMVKKLDYYDREKERGRDRKQEIPRSGSVDKKELMIRNKERLPIDDRNKRTDHHPRLRDREEKIKEKEREKRDERREERRDKGKEKERERSREIERGDREDRRERENERDRHRNDTGRRRHIEDPAIRRPRDDREIMATQRFINKKRDRDERDRDDEPESLILSTKKRNIERGIESLAATVPPRPPIKLNRSVEHINDLASSMPLAPMRGKRGDKRDNRNRY
ncbi:THO complex subunit 2 [Gigaspora margarita]|uniref:THO complex subunit 2 n=2 Tax=Gigaspora margarita TaxID=4874 RepID=A0A8H3X985_GIGMA|nr:THO complex subunit 2 [Gigaspora margarita]